MNTYAIESFQFLSLINWKMLTYLVYRYGVWSIG